MQNLIYLIALRNLAKLIRAGDKATIQELEMYKKIKHYTGDYVELIQELMLGHSIEEE